MIWLIQPASASYHISHRSKEEQSDSRKWGHSGPDRATQQVSTRDLARPASSNYHKSPTDDVLCVHIGEFQLCRPEAKNLGI